MPKVKNSLWRKRSFGQIAFHILEVISTASCSLLAPFGAPAHTTLLIPRQLFQFRDVIPTLEF